jgi:hypothetical protein
MKNLSNKNIPKLLYKYRNFEKSFFRDETHLDDLKNGTIYFSTPLSLNDPFDCQIPINYMEFIDNPEAAREYIAKGMKNFKELHDPKINFNAEASFQNLTNAGFIDKLIVDEMAELNERFGVFCLSKTHTNMLMWSHYANSHSGFCFGINTKKLKAEDFYTSEKIIYHKKYPLISPNAEHIDALREQLLHKSTDWSYEKEYRLIGIDCPDRAYQIPFKSIEQIILGINVSPENEERILELKGSILKHVRFYKMKKSKTEFKIIPGLIN